VLLAVDGVHIEGKNLGDIMNMLKGKSTNIVTLTFLNKEWFNNFDRDSVKTGTAIQKKGKYFTVFLIKDNLLIWYNKTVFYVNFSTPL
jgi:hypothetical protein